MTQFDVTAWLLVPLCVVSIAFAVGLLWFAWEVRHG